MLSYVNDVSTYLYTKIKENLLLFIIFSFLLCILSYICLYMIKFQYIFNVRLYKNNLINEKNLEYNYNFTLSLKKKIYL